MKYCKTFLKWQCLCIGIFCQYYYVAGMCECCDRSSIMQVENSINTIKDWYDHDTRKNNLNIALDHINDLLEYAKMMADIKEIPDRFCLEELHKYFYWSPLIIEKNKIQPALSIKKRFVIDNPHGKNHETYTKITDTLNNIIKAQRAEIMKPIENAFNQVIDTINNRQIQDITAEIYKINAIMKECFVDTNNVKKILNGLKELSTDIFKQDLPITWDKFMVLNDNVFQDNEHQKITTYITNLRNAYEQLKAKYLIQYLQNALKCIPIEDNAQPVDGQKKINELEKITISERLSDYINRPNNFLIYNTSQGNKINVNNLLELVNAIQNISKIKIDNNTKYIYKIFKSSIQLTNDSQLSKQIICEINNIKQLLYKLFNAIVVNMVQNVKVVKDYFASNENNISSKDYQNKIQQLCDLSKTLNNKYTDQDNGIYLQDIAKILAFTKHFNKNNAYQLEVEETCKPLQRQNISYINTTCSVATLFQCVNTYLYRYTNYFKDIINKHNTHDNKNVLLITELSQYRDVSDLCKINHDCNTIVFLTGENGWQQLVDFFASFGIDKPLLPCITTNLSITNIPHKNQKKEMFSGLSELEKFIKETNTLLVSEYYKYVKQVFNMATQEPEAIPQKNHQNDSYNQSGELHKQNKINLLTKFFTGFFEKYNFQDLIKTRDKDTYYLAFPVLQEVYEICDAYDIKYNYKIVGKTKDTMVHLTDNLDKNSLENNDTYKTVQKWFQLQKNI